MNDKQTEVVFIAPDLGNENGVMTFENLSSSERGAPLTWGPTPLIHSSEIATQQLGVESILSPLFEKKNIPFKVSSHLVEYVENLNFARTINRETRNQESFLCRRKTDHDGMKLENIELITRAVKGHASPAELLYLAEVFGVPTIELGSLTHPYGHRMEFLEPMRAATNKAIELMGGILANETPTYEVKGGDNLRFTDDMRGIHMTRKTLMGLLPNGFEVVERSSFVVALKHLPEETVAAIKAIPYGENWAEQVYNAGELSRLIPAILENDEFEKAIPVSTTVVAIHEELSKELLTSDARRERQKRMFGYHGNLIKNLYEKEEESNN